MRYSSYDVVVVRCLAASTSCAACSSGDVTSIVSPDLLEPCDDDENGFFNTFLIFSLTDLLCVEPSVESLVADASRTTGSVKK